MAGESKKMRARPTTNPELELRLREPLAEADVRVRNGQEYVSIGDTYWNLTEDFGATGYDVIVAREVVCDPFEEERDELDNKRKPVIDSKTGEVTKRVGYTCYAYAVVELVLHLPNGEVRRKQGVGAHSSEMQPNGAMAYENAVKGAKSDALKRAAAPLGPRYGLALLFNETKGDDRVAMGLIVEPEVLVKARAARDAKKQVTVPTPPGSVPAAATPAAGSSNAAVVGAAGSAPLPAAPSQVGAASPQPAPTGNGVAGAGAPPAASLAADFTKAPDQRVATVEVRDVARDVASGVITAEDIVVQPAVPGYGKVYGEKASEVRRLEQTGALLNGQYDPAWVEPLRLGGAAPFCGDIPKDPTADELKAAGWGRAGATPEELCLIAPANQIPLPMQQALVTSGVGLAGREAFGALWKALGCPVGKQAAPPNGLQARLLALASIKLGERRAVAK